MCCMCDRVNSPLWFDGCGPANHSANRHGDRPGVGRRWAAAATAAVQEKWVPRSRGASVLLRDPLKHTICPRWLKSAWIMTVCHISRCGTSWSEAAGDPRGPSHLCLLTSEALRVTTQPFSPFKYIYIYIYRCICIMSILHSKLFLTSPCGEHHSLFIYMNKWKNKKKMEKMSVVPWFTFNLFPTQRLHLYILYSSASLD